MPNVKYVGFDVHQSTVSVAVLEENGKLILQSVLATQAGAILDFVRGLRGTIHITFEEGTHSAWLYDLLAGRAARVVVCNPRKNTLLQAGNKSDTIDAHKLAELLRAGLLSAVYHGETSTTTLKQLGRSYTALTEDSTRVMGRIKALYRGQAVICAGKKPFAKRYRGEWLAQLCEPGTHRRAERLYEELDAMQSLRRQARQELIVESRKHPAVKLLRTVPFLGPIRAALDRSGANATPLPDQAAVLGLLRCGAGDAQQRGLPLPGRPTGAPQQAGVYPRSERKSQSRSEKPV